ncbi:MAG: polyhydroxyalkanoate depolymerase, partial [Gammaproteobacteria bacterium]
MLYYAYELSHAFITPIRSVVDMGQVVLKSPLNPLSYTLPGRTAAATLDVIERATRRYGKPRFDIDETSINDQKVKIRERTVWRNIWCQVTHFERDPDGLRQARGASEQDPKLLIIAPLSGHYATLLRGTVEAMLPDHDVYITDWIDARTIPVWRGRFDLNDYIDYLLALYRFLGPDLHVMAVCQPGPAALAATSLLAQDNDPNQPASLILMGSPIDSRKSPTVPNLL